MQGRPGHPQSMKPDNTKATISVVDTCLPPHADLSPIVLLAGRGKGWMQSRARGVLRRRVKEKTRRWLEVVALPPSMRNHRQEEGISEAPCGFPLEAPFGRSEPKVVGHHKEHIVLMTSSLLLILHIYFPIHSDPLLFFTSAVSYLFVIPMVIIHVFFKSDLRAFGFTVGTWPFRKGHTFLALLVVALLLYGASFLPEFQAYYLQKVPLDPGQLFVFLFLSLGFYFFAWEFFFRGYLLFGLVEQFGGFAVVLQEVPFALMHIGKPSLEALSAGLAGLLFGYISYRSGSFLYAFLIHWAMNILLLSLIVFK